MRRLVAGMLAAVALSGCSLIPSPPESDDNVAAPRLAAAKERAGIDDCPKTGEAQPVEGGLPEATLACLGGGPEVSLAALSGKPVVLNLWASWCQPCRNELPLFARLHDEESEQIAVLGVDFKDGNPLGALELARETGVTYPLVADPSGEIASDLTVVGLPQTVFVDAQGAVVATERREFTSYADLAAAVERHLGVTL